MTPDVLRVARKAGLAAEVLAGLAGTRRALQRDDLPAYLASIRTVPERPGSRAELARLAGATVRVLDHLPGDTRCLTRSLVLARLLARRGMAFTLVIGVRSAPEFEAHAWIEQGGMPLLPPGGATYQRLVEL